MRMCKECGCPHYAKGYCIKHYFKSRRTTTRELIPEDAQCGVEGCEKRPVAKGMCKYHYERNRVGRLGKDERGRFSDGRPKKEMVGYRAAHKRVEAQKGKATQHMCVDCGGIAREWSLDPLAVHTYEDGNKVWSLNIDDYSPRCIPCHRDLDGYGWHDYTD